MSIMTVYTIKSTQPNPTQPNNANQAGGCGLERACHSTGSPDLVSIYGITRSRWAARDEVYAVDLK